jgi:hypothetical protein
MALSCVAGNALAPEILQLLEGLLDEAHGDNRIVQDVVLRLLHSGRCERGAHEG